MDTTRHRKLEKSDSIPTDEIIYGTDPPEPTKTTENVEGIRFFAI